jgi:hypothetical protein
MKTDELLVTQLGAVRLRMELDRVPLWRGDDVEVRQLAEDFAQYLYLPRLQRTSVLTEAVSGGLDLITWRTESFAYAERKDAVTGRYHGLRCGEPARVSVEIGGWLVRPQVAEAQRAADIAKTASARGTSTIVLAGEPASGVGQGHRDGSPTAEAKPALPTRFYGTVQVDARRLGRDAGRIAEEVLAHLLGVDGAAVTVTLEIRADIDKGIEQNIVRAITENCRTLNFKAHGFEET